jgi:LacI family transcriptional regulator
MVKKSITIKDIAKIAGVSKGTVDRVIHNRGGVSEESLQKVQAILEEINYKPNLIAKTLGSKKTFLIAALVPNGDQDEYWDESRKGILQAGDEWVQYGIKVQLYSFNLYEKDSFKKASKKVLENNPDGVLVAPVFYKEALQFFEDCHESKIPYVLFNTYINEASPLSFIGQDLFQSGRLGAELLHLNQHGPSTFAILHIYDDIHDSINLSEKEKGFKEYFKEKGNGEFNIISVDLSHPTQESMEDGIKKLLNDSKLKGILITTSKGAPIVASYLEKYGKNGIKLVGYDLLEKNLKYLRSGVIDFLINQNPKRQSLLGIRQLANHLLFKKEITPKALFPLEIITQQNLDSYLNYQIH